MSTTAPNPPSSSAGPAGTLDPVLAALTRIERRLEAVERVACAIAPSAELAQTLPGAVAVLIDTFDGVAARLGEAGVNLDERMRSVGTALEVATAPRAVAGLTALVESRLLEPSSLATVSQLASALAEHGSHEPVGMWGALRALRDPDVQRALGFLLAVARQFGKNLAAGGVEECRDRLAAPGSLTLEGAR